MNQYKPDYAIPPGETIKEIFEYCLGLKEGQFLKLLSGDVRITPKIAEKIVCLIGGFKKEYWLAAEKNYIKTKKRLNK